MADKSLSIKENFWDWIYDMEFVVGGKPLRFALWDLCAYNLKPEGNENGNSEPIQFIQNDGVT